MTVERTAWSSSTVKLEKKNLVRVVVKFFVSLQQQEINSLHDWWSDIYFIKNTEKFLRVEYVVFI